MFFDTFTSPSADLLHLLGPPELLSPQCLQIKEGVRSKNIKEALWALERTMPRTRMHGVSTASDITLLPRWLALRVSEEFPCSSTAVLPNMVATYGYSHLN